HFARRNALGSKQDRHGGSEVFAVSGARFEQKVRQRVLARFSGQIQRVRVARAQIGLDANRFVKGGVGVFGDFAGQFRNPRVELGGELQVGRSNVTGIVRSRGAQLRRIAGRQTRNAGVPEGGEVVKRICQSIRPIRKKIVALHRGKGIGRPAAEISLQG